MKPNIKYCPECGTKNKNPKRYCFKCGKPMIFLGPLVRDELFDIIRENGFVNLEEFTEKHKIQKRDLIQLCHDLMLAGSLKAKFTSDETILISHQRIEEENVVYIDYLKKQGRIDLTETSSKLNKSKEALKNIYKDLININESVKAAFSADGEEVIMISQLIKEIKPHIELEPSEIAQECNITIELAKRLLSLIKRFQK